MIAPWPPALPPPGDVKQLSAERDVLGAMLTGSLGLRDLALAPDGLCSHLRHRGIFGVLLSLLEARADGMRVPGKTGIPWRLAERACTVCRVWPIAVLSVAPPILCGLLDLARAAPRRRVALMALDFLADEAGARAEETKERAQLAGVVADVEREARMSYLLGLSRDAAEGGFAAVPLERCGAPWPPPWWQAPEVLPERAPPGRQAWISAGVIREAMRT